MRTIYIFDTSVLCCWLQVPGKDECGPEGDRWDNQRINALVTAGIAANSVFVLPIATIIETGNHIAQANGNIFQIANKLSDLMTKAANETSPWAAFDGQIELWSKESLITLANAWPELANQGIGIGDATIKDVAEYYAKSNTVSVEILTGDQGLKAYQPTAPAQLAKPRRRH
ncbi:hypothetical protein [Enterovibrio baiacu]|uniref:hypothetical protein n=1 Tax=Enterovibrio baiacu TaxID=2491023 RepID=UPI00101189DA|nr:hypothetical protein [Enterovibrio baiacu]MBE1275647.1 hypothetical protein [Enterovibrio baiacu]